MRRVMVVLLLITASCWAAPVAEADWRIDRAQRVAEAAWNSPCDGNVRLVYWAAPPAGEARADAWAEPATCTVTLTKQMPRDWLSVCMAVLHEYGHLAGFWDSRNPHDPYHARPGRRRSIMVRGGELNEGDWRCQRRGQPFLREQPRNRRARAGKLS